MRGELPPAREPKLTYDGARALVIDDEASIAAVLCRALERVGLAADPAFDGRDGLARLGTGHYDVVLCDLRMPDVSGQQIFERVTAERPELASRIIFLTGDVASEDAIDFLRTSGCRFLAKPFELWEVISAVDAVLADRLGEERSVPG